MKLLADLVNSLEIKSDAPQKRPPEIGIVTATKKKENPYLQKLLENLGHPRQRQVHGIGLAEIVALHRMK